MCATLSDRREHRGATPVQRRARDDDALIDKPVRDGITQVLGSPLGEPTPLVLDIMSNDPRMTLATCRRYHRKPTHVSVNMRQLRYLHLDVFAANRGGGNHLGVVIGADGWDAAAMQRFARWNNLVETTFLLAPTDPHASYRVRIFSPTKEVAFAGHPSVGSAHAALVCGLASPSDGVLWQECAIGTLPIAVEGNGEQRHLLLQSPAARVVYAGTDAQPLLAATLAGMTTGKLPPALVEGGRRWWVAEIAGETALRNWQPDHIAIGELARATNSMGLCAFARSTSADYQLAVRAFGDGAGIPEDPASGAANGLLAAYLAQAEPAGPLACGYRVSQGREIGHDAELIVRVEGDRIWVGGRVNTILDGTLEWDAGSPAACSNGVSNP